MAEKQTGWRTSAGAHVLVARRSLDSHKEASIAVCIPPSLGPAVAAELVSKSDMVTRVDQNGLVGSYWLMRELVPNHTTVLHRECADLGVENSRPADERQRV